MSSSPESSDVGSNVYTRKDVVQELRDVEKIGDHSENRRYLAKINHPLRDSALNGSKSFLSQASKSSVSNLAVSPYMLTHAKSISTLSAMYRTSYLNYILASVF